MKVFKKLFYLFLFIILFLFLFTINNFANNSISFQDKEGNEFNITLPEKIISDKYNFFIAQSSDNFYLIATKYNYAQLYFSNDTYFNYNDKRAYFDIYYFNYDTNSFYFVKNNFYINANLLYSNGFKLLYISDDFPLFCQHDDGGYFKDNETLGYHSNYELSVSFSFIDGYYRIYTNWFDFNSGIQKYWGSYIWLSDEPYIPLEDCDPIEGSGWYSFDNYEEKIEDGISYFRFYYDVSSPKNYIICFENTITQKYVYFDLDLNSSGLSFSLSNTEKTTEPIYIWSNKYYYEGDYNAENDFLLNYDIDISYGFNETYKYAPFLYYGYDEELQKNYTQYRFQVVANSIYTLKILNFTTQEISYETFNITNIGVDNIYGDDIYYNNYDEEGNFNPTPVLFLEYVDSTTVRIRTQPFTFNEIINLKCYTKFEDGDFSQNRNIYNYTIQTENSIYDDGIKENYIDLYYFYLDIQVDGNYTFQFYIIDTKNITESSINVDINEFIINNIDNIEKFNDKMIAWSKLHFGFLTYPFELIINIFGRIININYEQPILKIPELKDPFTKVVFLNSINYDFNNILEIKEVNYLYNIYLIIVDVILIFLFVNLCKNTFEEVFK